MRAKSQNFIVIISGVGGAGKDSILEYLRRQPEKFAFSVSYTDRARRSEEREGENYHYISAELFDKAIERGEFIEWEKTRGQYRYGRKKSELDEAIASGKIPVMQMDVLGAEKFRRMGYDIVSFFIMPPSFEEAKRRLEKRNADTPAQLAERLNRYKFEISHKDKYDHIIINDNLETAQKELSKLISNEKVRREHRQNVKKTIHNFFLILTATVFLGLAGASAYTYYALRYADLAVRPIAVSGDLSSGNTDNTGSTAQSIAAAPPSQQAQSQITITPPKHNAPKTATTKTSTDSNGSKTVVFSTGGTADSASLGNANAVVSSPSNIPFTDSTGSHADLGPILRDYLNNTLLWKGEISAMKQITLLDAGDTGWTGQYLGSYKTTADGQKIISVTGSIVLNSYYYKSSPYFNDYMKLTFSHEYGHHYTLYHKWLDWNLPLGVRFPDSYYSTRPLSKTTTATDYSLGWGNCEAEIIAEDYSWLYSGYGYHGMASTYGYPSLAMKDWFAKIGDPSLLSVQVNNPPVVSILSPTAGAVLSGAAVVEVSATDDTGVSSVSFYVDSSKISDDNSVPYEANLDTTVYSNGAHTIKAVASDGSLSSEMSVTVSILNPVADTVPPVVSFVLPASNPYDWSTGNLNLKVVATDDVKVAKVEIYINDQLELTSAQAQVLATWKYADAGPGQYTLKAKAYDSSGNIAETTLIVNKT